MDKQIEDYCKEYIKTCRVIPTMRDMQKRFGISSTSVVDYHVQKLVRAGKIRKDGNRYIWIEVKWK